MIAGLLVLTVVAAVAIGAKRTHQWITSAPAATKQDALSRFRRTLHARIESENLFCRSCHSAVAGPDGYCSDCCAT